MKTGIGAFVTSALLTLSLALAIQSVASTQGIDSALEKAIRARAAARAAKDVAAWARMTADDAVEIHSDGRIHSKTEEAAEIKSGAPAAPAAPNTDVKVRMYGSSAVYTAVRNPPDGARCYTVVWVKGADGQWRAVLSQQTLVK